MLLNTIQYGFVAGELSPTLLGRTDLEKYDLGLELAQNYFVDYRGGLSTRPGSEFVDFVMHDDEDTKFFPFKFAPNVDSTYVMLFGDHYIRFIQDGAYVLEPGFAISAVAIGATTKITAPGHNLVAGDWVKIFDAAGTPDLNQRTFVVSGVAGNDFYLLDPLTAAAIDSTTYGTYTGGGHVYRIYTINSPYDSLDLAALRGYQSRSQVTFTHNDYPVYDLVRTSDTNWALNLRVFGAPIQPPTSITLTPSAAGTAGVAVAVTSVDADGNESIASAYAYNTLTVDYTTTAGQLKITWPAVAGAVKYRVYRSLILPVGTDISRAQDVGFIGTAFGPQLIDRNIIPDFTQTPPGNYNPFADNSIDLVLVTAAGSGYTRASTVSTSGGGTGFLAYPVVDSGGGVLGIVIVNGGKGYVNPTITVSGGTGATFTATTTPASGNSPGVSSIFQQRQVFAASKNKPLTVWGSQPKDFSNMNVSSIIRESDSYEFELDSEEVASIQHLVTSRSGLVLVSQAGIWQLTGGNGVAVTPTNALADPQSFTGCSTIPPIPIDTDILYIESKGTTVRLLSYSDYTKVFSGQDMSILSNHLMSASKQITSWTYAADPYKLVQGVRSDGQMLTMAIVKEQNVFAWTHYTTKGLYKDVLCLQEGNTDAVYQMVQRFVNGRTTKFIERVASRQFVDVEDAWCVDAGLTNSYNYPAALLTAAAATGTAVTFTASAAVFGAGDVGKVIRGGGGKAVITSFVSTTQVVANIKRPITLVLEEDPLNRPLVFNPTEWTLDAPITKIGGLWHLEGETLAILADGNVVPQKTVVDGAITLDSPATRVIVGIPYTCVAKSLSPSISSSIIEAKLKRVIGVKLRVNDTRGLQMGPTLDNLTSFIERTDEPPGEPTRLQQGLKPRIVDAAFGVDGQIYYVQKHPLPATILGFINELELGDDNKAR